MFSRLLMARLVVWLSGSGYARQLQKLQKIKRGRKKEMSRWKKKDGIRILNCEQSQSRPPTRRYIALTWAGESGEQNNWRKLDSLSLCVCVRPRVQKENVKKASEREEGWRQQLIQLHNAKASNTLSLFRCVPDPVDFFFGELIRFSLRRRDIGLGKHCEFKRWEKIRSQWVGDADHKCPVAGFDYDVYKICKRQLRRSRPGRFRLLLFPSLSLDFSTGGVLLAPTTLLTNTNHVRHFKGKIKKKKMHNPRHPASVSHTAVGGIHFSIHQGPKSWKSMTQRTAQCIYFRGFR